MTIDYEARVCPVCGSSLLEAMVYVKAIQNIDGAWAVEVDDNDLQECMTNLNTAVVCGNQFCGEIYDEDGLIVPYIDSLSVEENWIAIMNARYNNFLGFIGPDQLTDEQREKARAWYESFHHIPWSGVLGDCKLISQS